MKVQIDSIKIGKRFRKDLGDLSPLKTSMAELGLLQPIGVTSENVLVFGERRLCAAGELDWTEIEAQRIDLDNPLLAEQDENICREDFKPSEKLAIARAIEDREAERLKKNQQAAGGDRGNQHTGGKIGACANSAQAPMSGQKARNIAAKAVGISRPTLDKIEIVVDAVEENPLLASVLEEMDRTGKVEPAYQKVIASKPKEKARPNGSYSNWKTFKAVIGEIKDRLATLRSLRVDSQHLIPARTECENVADAFTDLAKLIMR